MNKNDIAHRFAFHAATTEEKRDAHTSVRQQCKRLADALNEQLPDGREKSLAITKIEEAMFWGNAALARENAGTHAINGFIDAIDSAFDRKKNDE